MINDALEVTNRQLLEEIVKTRSDLKNLIEASETRLQMKFEILNNRIKTLEKENIKLNDKIEKLERESKKNNLVIFGLVKNSKEVTAASICNHIRQLLDVKLTETEINNIYTLGKTENSPIKLELISYLKKREILGNCRKLKGTKTYITNDLTEKQREEVKILRTHLHQAKAHTDKKSYIKGNRLFVDNIAYTAEELLYNEHPKAKNNSAPLTPNPYSYSQEDSETLINPPSCLESKGIETRKGTGEEAVPYSRESKDTPKTGAIKKTNKQTEMVKETFRGRLRSNK